MALEMVLKECRISQSNIFAIRGWNKNRKFIELIYDNWLIPWSLFQLTLSNAFQLIELHLLLF